MYTDYVRMVAIREARRKGFNSQWSRMEGGFRVVELTTGDVVNIPFTHSVGHWGDNGFSLAREIIAIYVYDADTDTFIYQEKD